jgi:hypothetical protein
MLIPRDYRRNERDDFKLHVEDQIGLRDGCTPQYDQKGNILGWVIKPMYE